MIDIQSTIQAAEDLAQGAKKPSVKLALWAAALSPNQPLEKNGRLVELLRPYVYSPLPQDKSDLYNYLRQAKGVLFSRHIQALYAIEQAEKEGLLDGLEDIGTGYLEQCLWRKNVLALLKGHGLGYKTASFAALILDPLHCELVPVDRHVMARLGKPHTGSPQREKPYLEIEQEILQERNLAGMSHIPLGLYHWLKWDEYRASLAHWNGYQGNGGIESHSALNCRVY